MSKKQEVIKFKRGIKRINFPVHQEFNGEIQRLIWKIQKFYKLPKYRIIGLEYRHCIDPRIPFDLTQVFIEK